MGRNDNLLNNINEFQWDENNEEKLNTFTIGLLFYKIK